MSFFDAFTNENARLALRRTEAQWNQGYQYLSANPGFTGLALASFVALMVWMPAPVMIGVAVSALALICFNLFTPPTFMEQVRSSLSSFLG